MQVKTERTRRRHRLPFLLSLVVLGGACHAESDENFEAGTRLTYAIPIRDAPELGEEASNVVRQRIGERFLSLGVTRFRVRLEGSDRLIVELAARDAETVGVARRAVEREGRVVFEIVARVESSNERDVRLQKAREEAEESAMAMVKEVERHIRTLEEWKKRQDTDPKSAGPRPTPPSLEGIVLPPDETIDSQQASLSQEQGEDLPPEERPRLVLSEDVLESASVTTDRDGRSVIVLTLTDEGGEVMEQITGRNLGGSMAFMLDDDVLATPVIHDKIGRRLQIRGPWSRAEARVITAALRSGPLPVSLEFVKREDFGPEASASRRTDDVPTGEGNGPSPVDRGE